MFIAEYMDAYFELTRSTRFHSFEYSKLIYGNICIFKGYLFKQIGTVCFKTPPLKVKVPIKSYLCVS